MFLLGQEHASVAFWLACLADDVPGTRAGIRAKDDGVVVVFGAAWAVSAVRVSAVGEQSLVGKRELDVPQVSTPTRGSDVGGVRWVVMSFSSTFQLAILVAVHSLAESSILDAAAERFGVAEPLEPSFAPAFRALLRALHEEARLSPAGRERTRERLIRALGRRVALAELERREPSVTTIAVERPIVVTGFPRTGTTLLHNLLARVDGLWAPPLWQLRSPVAPSDATPDWEQQQREGAAAMLDEIYAAAPSFQAIHPMHPDWPDECNWLLRNCFSTLVNAFSWFVPGYVEYLRTSDMRPAYADHRRFFRALLHRHGARPRLALKDPFHMWHVEAFLAAYPDATIIQLHREPEQIVPSLASLCATLQSIDTDSPRTQAEIGRYSLYILGQGLRALEQARRTLPAERFIDIPYRELVASPGAVLLGLGERLGFDARGVAVEEASRWLAQNRQHKLGRHRYSLEDFGLTSAIIEEYFADYRARFGPLLD